MACEKKEYMTSDLGISSHVVTKDNGFLELQNFLKHDHHLDKFDRNISKAFTHFFVNNCILTCFTKNMSKSFLFKTFLHTQSIIIDYKLECNYHCI